MDMQKILVAAKSHPELKATFAFKLEESMKDEFIHICTREGLSAGAVMRELLTEWLANMKAPVQKQLELPFDDGERANA